MTGRTCDIAIVGGGLAGGLMALALHRHAPHLRLTLIEAGETLGGNHRWSWFASDVSAAGAELLGEFAVNRWDEGYDVTFPRHSRTLPTGYRSLASEAFHAGLIARLPPESVRLSARAAMLDATGVTLDDGERIGAGTVIDCRTLRPSAHLTGGWQVFLGQHIKCAMPHGLARPVIMDATVDQVAPFGNGGAYRFVYVLPLSEDEVFVEDTYYADDPKLDRAQLQGRTQAYCRDHGWQGEVIAEETGVLPVITGGDFAAAQAEQRIPGVAMAGARGGFVHPLTSYTLPFAVETALAVAHTADLSGDQLAARLEVRARGHWRAMGFYRLLGRMLFGAARPAERYRVFERFYRLSETLIERFYAGRSTCADRARVLAGRPPVPLSRAVAALTRPAPPLRAPEHEDNP